MVEAKVVLVGGHSIDDPELKYGVSVTGIVHPKKLVTNSGAKLGTKSFLLSRWEQGL
jgi:selenide,water dikinase